MKMNSASCEKKGKAIFPGPGGTSGKRKSEGVLSAESEGGQGWGISIWEITQTK